MDTYREELYQPTDAPMTPIEGIRFYADALRGDWGNVDGRSEEHSLNAYVDWAMTVTGPTTEKDVLPKVEAILGVYLRASSYTPDAVSRRGCWYEHAEDLINARDDAAGQ